MRVSFRHADFEALAELWNAFYPPQFAIDAALLELNTVDNDLFDWGASFIDLGDDLRPTAFAYCKRSADGLYAGAERDVSYLGGLVYGTPSAGLDLLKGIKQVLVERGVYRLIFGQDSGHFFPGCPMEVPHLKDFLIVEGFEEGSPVYDMGADLGACVFKLNPDVVPCTDALVPSLREFMASEFPGRWSYDLERKLAAEANPSFVDVLLVDGRVQGFSVTQRPGCRLRIAGACFDRGESSAALGPIGVAKSVRGKGLGDALLSASLARLKADGVRQCCIDWTDLDAWYGKHGFSIANRYLAFGLWLD